MLRGCKSAKSGYPSDLRTDAPAGEVKTTWQPEAFTWYGEDVRTRGSRNEAFIYINPSILRISSTAARDAGLEGGDRVQIGVNKKFLAVKKSATGWKVWSERGKATSAVSLAAKRLINKISADGWPVPCRVSCVFDGESGMLVAKKPAPAQE